MHLSNLLEIPPENVSHNSKIKKQVLLKNNIIPNMTQFAISTFPPGEIAFTHSHQDMNEIFYVQSGNGLAIVDGVQHHLKP
ncbi:hypothetical protein BVY03_00775, partial [bacterium K02(2017)]